jgi:hypothetical protein
MELGTKSEAVRDRVGLALSKVFGTCMILSGSAAIGCMLYAIYIFKTTGSYFNPIGISWTNYGFGAFFAMCISYILCASSLLVLLK